MFASLDVTTIVSEDDLKEFCQPKVRRYEGNPDNNVQRHSGWKTYLPLRVFKKNEITNKARDLAFVKGIPKGLRDWFKRELPEANCTKDKPPTFESSRKILYQNFDHTSLFWDASDVKDKHSNFDEDGNCVGNAKVRLTTTRTTDPISRSTPGLPSSTTVDIDALTKAMDELNLNHLRVQ
ncbi:hypothetical protein PQX77_009687 [Marasmius sp. AFHP31]|nr:hypothetical protein PQX77_009687 [Marasmius sp. AFHP31]